MTEECEGTEGRVDGVGRRALWPGVEGPDHARCPPGQLGKLDSERSRKPLPHPEGRVKVRVVVVFNMESNVLLFVFRL